MPNLIDSPHWNTHRSWFIAIEPAPYGELRIETLDIGPAQSNPYCITLLRPLRSGDPQVLSSRMILGRLPTMEAACLKFVEFYHELREAYLRSDDYTHYLRNRDRLLREREHAREIRVRDRRLQEERAAQAAHQDTYSEEEYAES